MRSNAPPTVVAAAPRPCELSKVPYARHLKPRRLPPKIVGRSVGAGCREGAWCQSMSESLVWDGDASGKTTRGLSAVKGVRLGHARLRLGIVYRRTPNDRGTLLSKCPWCFADVLFFEPFSLVKNVVSR